VNKAISSTTLLSQKPDVIICDIDDGKALLDLDSSKYFKLNHVAAVVWEGIGAGGASLESLVELVTSKFEVSREQCDSDVRLLISSLCAAGITKTHEV
jgi:hypothetical protein